MSDKILTNNGYTPKILIVDDEKRIREGCHTILTREGYEVAFAEDGKKGLEMIDRETYNLLRGGERKCQEETEPAHWEWVQ